MSPFGHGWPKIPTCGHLVGPGTGTAAAHDKATPPVNAEFLAQRLPRSKLDILDAGHFTWEDAAAEYAALVTSWWDRGYAVM